MQSPVLVDFIIAMTKYLTGYLREERFLLGATWEGTEHHSAEGLVAGAIQSWQQKLPLKFITFYARHWCHTPL